MAIKCPKCQFENPDDAVYCGRCATPLRPEEISAPTETIEAAKEELTTGSTFAGRYQIIEELGKGGMGEVYKVHDTEIKEKVALKLLKTEIAADKKTIERFRNEIRLARKIVHQNVGRMFDLGKAEGSYFITMEYVPGQDLKGLIRQSRQLTVGTTINIAKQICEGLAEAHKLGVVHRDLKPQNIMIDRKGNARIMDFGIARSLKAKGITEAEVIIGTPEYMSPEQVEGKEADQRSDIYSLGIIIYEMATGRAPFEGDTPLSIAVKHKSEEPPDPRGFNAQIPEGLIRVIFKCMAKDKKKRYPKAEEVLSELARVEKEITTAERIIPKRKIEEEIGEIERKQSIAVLPFADLSPKKDQEYFCDGLAEELINALTKVENLKVASRTSTFQFKEKIYDIQEIGKKLNIKTILEGSVRKAGNRLRITAQLINLADGYHLWSEKYDRDMEDIFAIQDDVTLAIVDNLKVKLLGKEKAEILKRYTENVEAYKLYLKGRYFWNRRTEEDLKKGIKCFELALEKDPNYALAYAGLADCYIALPYYSSFPAKESYLKAKETAREALKRDNMLAEAHTSLACSKSYLRDWKGAEEEFRRAIELNPSYAIGHHWYSNYLMYLGRFDEAFDEIRCALDLDPLSLIINRDLGELFYFSRQYDKAIEQFRKVIEIDPNFIYLHIDLGIAYLQKSRYKEALAEIRKEPLDVWLGIAYGFMDKKTKAQQILDDLKEKSKREYVSPYLMALLCITLGEKDQGFGWLEKAYKANTSWLMYLWVDPLLESVHSDPRFQDLLRRMNFPD